MFNGNWKILARYKGPKKFCKEIYQPALNFKRKDALLFMHYYICFSQI